MHVRSLAWEDPLEQEMATHCSIVAWKIPQTEEPDGIQSTGLQRVGYNGSNLAHTHAVCGKPFEFDGFARRSRENQTQLKVP